MKQVTAISLFSLVLCAVAQAHRPIFSDQAATDPNTAVLISQPAISQVIYREITDEAKQVWLAFDANEGFGLFIQIGVPVLDRLKDFRPAMVVVGPGLPEENPPVTLPEGAGATSFTTTDIKEPRFFHEHFTGTDSWILQSETVALPKAGRYYVVAYVPSGENGKLWLSVGQQESFGLAEWSQFGEWKKKIRKFHEVSEEGGLRIPILSEIGDLLGSVATIGSADEKADRTKTSVQAHDGVLIHTVESEYQRGKQEIRVLLPDDYQKAKYYRVLYVLPVEKGFDQRYGDGLDVLKQMNAHNEYDLIIVQMGFDKQPWYGDHATDHKTRQASYLKEFVIPFIEKHYSTMQIPEARLLLGFSKSGWGAFSLIMTYPDFFGYAASWDAPMFFDKFHYRMERVYGTLDQLNRFRPDLLASKQKRHFRLKPRLVLTGEQGWGNSIPTPKGGSHTVEMHNLLKREGIKHIYDNTLIVEHRWSKEWMVPTLKALMGLVQDPLSYHKKAVVEAKELTESIEPDGKPWPNWQHVMKGQIDFNRDGHSSRVDVLEGGLGFWSDRILTVKTKGKPEELRLYMYWDGQDMYDPPHLSWSENAEDPLYAVEREFLEKIKYAYDYMSEEVILAQPDNPKYAVHYWGKDNGRIEEGKLTIRRYKGRPVSGLSKSKPRWEEGSVVFAKSSRGSLFGYDREVDEHFLLFHCDSKYEGPSVLAKVDTWLLVGLWGEGLVAIDLADHYLKRFPSVKETVGKIEITDSEIILDDGRHRIPLPIEKGGEKARRFYFGPRGAK